MRKDSAFGVLLGTGLTATSAFANFRRGDVHFVSVYPDLLPLLILSLVVFEITSRHAQAGATCEAAAFHGRRVSLIAAVVFAVGISSFSLLWLPSYALPLAAFGLATGFVLTFTAGYLASRWGSSRGSRTV